MELSTCSEAPGRDDAPRALGLADAVLVSLRVGSSLLQADPLVSWSPPNPIFWPSSAQKATTHVPAEMWGCPQVTSVHLHHGAAPGAVGLHHFPPWFCTMELVCFHKALLFTEANECFSPPKIFPACRTCCQPLSVSKPFHLRGHPDLPTFLSRKLRGVGVLGWQFAWLRTCPDVGPFCFSSSSSSLPASSWLSLVLTMEGGGKRKSVGQEAFL